MPLARSLSSFLGNVLFANACEDDKNAIRKVVYKCSCRLGVFSYRNIKGDFHCAEKTRQW